MRLVNDSPLERSLHELGCSHIDDILVLPKDTIEGLRFTDDDGNRRDVPRCHKQLVHALQAFVHFTKWQAVVRHEEAGTKPPLELLDYDEITLMKFDAFRFSSGYVARMALSRFSSRTLK